MNCTRSTINRHIFTICLLHFHIAIIFCVPIMKKTVNSTHLIKQPPIFRKAQH